jgi:N-acetylglucosaminyl-diphospho-decaprenol L-rhamnosyltransferase
VSDLAVVVVTYRSAETIGACLQSIPKGLEVVVVDNASDDDTVARVEGFGVRVIRNPDNRGFAAAANQGARATTAAAVLFLNPDAELGDGCAMKLDRALRDQPDLAIVGPARIDSPSGELTGYWPFPRAARTWANELGLSRLSRGGFDGDGFVVGTCLLMRRTWFDRLGGYDEEFWLYGEDADLGRRALALGGRSAAITDAAIHHIGGHSAARSAASFEQFHRGAELFIVKHYGVRSLLSHRLAVLVGAVARTLALWPAHRDRSRWFARLARRELRLLLRQPTTVAPR